MRIATVEHPKSLLVRFAYWMSRRKLGKVMTPLKAVYARIPKTIPVEYGIMRVLENGLSLDRSLQFLVQHHVARINGCGFCIDIGRAMAIGYRVDVAKLEAIDGYRSDARFSEGERAALAYVEEATREKRVSDATFGALRRHFDDDAIAEITWLCALENYFNLINLPLEIEADGLCAIAEGRRAA
jgi:AhpD family alkylhydroperoxidase